MTVCLHSVLPDDARPNSGELWPPRLQSDSGGQQVRFGRRASAHAGKSLLEYEMSAQQYKMYHTVLVSSTLGTHVRRN